MESNAPGSKFSVSREFQGGVHTVRLAGRIDGKTDLENLVGEVPDTVNFNCREVTYIDSQGAKTWMNFFSALVAKGVRFHYSECPPPVVEQMNYLARFTCGARVVSVSVTFACTGCVAEFQGVTRTENLKRVFYRLPPIKCLKCGSKAVFQETPEDYFAFLIRQDRDD